MTSELSQTDATDDEGYRVQRTRNKRKRMSPSSQATDRQSENGPIKQFSEAAKQPPNNPAASHQSARKTFIGKSCTAPLRASKTLQLKKAVFCLSNIDQEYSLEDVSDYIKSLGIRLLTCYELPRSGRQSADSKSFRLCIIAEDKDKLLDQSNWYVGVTLRNWVHKTNTECIVEGWGAQGTGRGGKGGVGQDLGAGRSVDLGGRSSGMGGRVGTGGTHSESLMVTQTQSTDGMRRSDVASSDVTNDTDASVNLIASTSVHTCIA